jgi:hypothetical protein
MDWSGAAGAATGGLLGMIGAGSQQRRQKELMGVQFKNQKELNKQGSDLQYEMWQKTNYPAQMKMLEEAGLNPALMYGQSGGGGTTAGSQSGGSAAGGQAAAMDISQAANLALIGAQTEKMKAETGEIKERTKSESGTLENMLAELSADERQQYRYMQTRIQDMSFEKLASEATKISYEGAKSGRENDLLNKNFDNLVELNNMEIIKRGLEIKLGEENINKTKEEIDVLANSVYQRWAEVGIKGVDGVLKGVLGTGGVGALMNLIKKLKPGQ